MSSFTPAGLFGGAIVADLPSNFADVSQLRQVPDNQEVYLDTNGLTSIIFDIAERVDAATAPTDDDALKYHFDDISSNTSDTTKLWPAPAAALAKMPSIPALTLFATQHPESTSSSRKPQPDFTGIMLVLVRLVEQRTDIVITVNIPHVSGEYSKDAVDLESGKTGALLDAAMAARQRILETFEIKDWDLFVNEA